MFASVPLTVRSRKMQLVYEVILVNKILRNHLLSENMQLDYSIWVWPE